MKIATYTFFYGSLAVWAFLAVFGFFVGDVVDLLASMMIAPAILAGALMMLLYAAIKPSWAKAREVVVALAVGAGLLVARPQLSTAGLELFWGVRETQATAFVAELLSYARIREMDTGDRHFKELNGELVAYSPAQVDTQHVHGLRPTLPLQSVLQRDAIDPRIYEMFRQRLRSLGFIHVEVHDEYIAFVRDGMLDNLYGFVWIPPGHKTPELGSEFVSETQLVLLRPLGGHWYFFATT
jgi:hypothetical protein